MSRAGTRLTLRGLPKGGSLTELAAFLAHSLRNTSPNRFLHRLEQVWQQVSAVALDKIPVAGWTSSGPPAPNGCGSSSLRRVWNERRGKSWR